MKNADSEQNHHSVHVFTSPARIDRTNRQRSVFSIATFKDNLVLKPLDELVNQNGIEPVRKFTVPSQIKPVLRQLLSNLALLALDAYSIYGDPDPFGKSISVHFDTTGLKLDVELHPKQTEHGQ